MRAARVFFLVCVCNRPGRRAAEPGGAAAAIACVLEVILEGAVWRARRAAHASRVRALTADRRARAARGVPDPINDFLYVYYPFSLAERVRWSPGAGAALADAGELSCDARFCARGGDGLLRVKPPDARAAARLRFSLALCHAVASRAPYFACHGLHEWAMVYQGAPRHDGVPLRLGAAATDEALRALPLRCTHYDAVRHFSPPAAPLNRACAPTLHTRLANEQPGCLHVTMDLFKWAQKAQPWVPAELAADAAELAGEARQVDMRASPYDLAAAGLPPIRVETAAGRAEYEAAQRALHAKAAPLRARLAGALERALACTEV